MPTSSTRAKPIYRTAELISRSQRARSSRLWVAIRTATWVVARSRPRRPRQPRRRASASARRARAAVAPRSVHARARASGASRSSSGRAAGKGSREPQLGIELLHPPACLVPVEAADLGEEEQIPPPGETKVEGAILRQQCADQATGSERGCCVSTDQDATASSGTRVPRMQRRIVVLPDPFVRGAPPVRLPTARCRRRHGACRTRGRAPPPRGRARIPRPLVRERGRTPDRVSTDAMSSLQS